LVGFDSLALAGVPITAYYLPEDGFQTLKLRAQTGRLLSAGDASTNPPGVVLREELAYWLIRASKEGAGRTVQPQDFVGKQLRVGQNGSQPKTYVIVGVAGKGPLGPKGFQGALAEQTAVVYLPAGLIPGLPK
jgi:hypothetical protein